MNQQTPNALGDASLVLISLLPHEPHVTQIILWSQRAGCVSGEIFDELSTAQFAVIISRLCYVTLTHHEKCRAKTG